MANQSFTITVNVKELFTEFIPKLARRFFKRWSAGDEFQGTELTITVDISGSLFSFTVKDGTQFTAQEGALENPMIYASIPLESMSKLAEMKNIDFIMGIQNQLNLEKFAILSGLKGTSVFRMEHEDSSISDITLIFNSSREPKAVFNLSMEDAGRISRGQETPVQLFMGGRMKIDGEIAFAMSLQPLFT